MSPTSLVAPASPTAQAAGSVSSGVGCWNWASYEDDPLFDTQRGVQLQTVLKLVDRLDDSLPAAQPVVGDYPPGDHPPSDHPPSDHPPGEIAEEARGSVESPLA